MESLLRRLITGISKFRDLFVLAVIEIVWQFRGLILQGKKQHSTWKASNYIF